MAVVLIVEDEEQVRVLAEAIVQELGHETLTAGTAEQALAVIEERPDVDLLFTDIGLQQDLEAGLQLAKGIAARKPGLPVLYTTGQGVTDGMRAMFADPFGFLPKPYTPRRPDDRAWQPACHRARPPGRGGGQEGARPGGVSAVSFRAVSFQYL
jgi:DNA-binding NtrC family response regulator